MSKRCPKGTHWNPSRGECDREALRRASLGKFEGGLHIDRYLWESSLEGGSDEDAGDVTDAGMHYSIFRGTLLETVKRHAKENDDKLTNAEMKMLKGSRGAIISESDTGSIFVDYYETKEKLNGAWKQIENNLNMFYEEKNMWRE